jgi:hypothetical protein
LAAAPRLCFCRAFNRLPQRESRALSPPPQAIGRHRIKAVDLRRLQLTNSFIESRERLRRLNLARANTIRNVVRSFPRPKLVIKQRIGGHAARHLRALVIIFSLRSIRDLR